MTKPVLLLHAHYDADHLAEVKSEMESRGAPTLRAIVTDDAIYLLEGCHRARAAADLGLTVNVVPVKYDWELDDHYPLDAWVTGLDSDCMVSRVTGSVGSSDQFIDVEIELLDAIEPNRY